MTLPGYWRSPLDPERVMNVRVTHWQEQTQQRREEALTVEEPFEVRIDHRSLAVIMRTPGNDHELALGFLFTEGVISQPGEILAIEDETDADGLPLANVVNVTLQNHTRLDQQSLKASTLYELPARLRTAQSVFTHTGGLHAAGLFSSSGELLLLREDVGRHNAVDKLIGHGLLHGTFPYPEHILMVSGRTSFEIIQKALLARIPWIAAISAPSSLAVELADRAGITLIGFLRDHSMNVYTHPERIV